MRKLTDLSTLPFRASMTKGRDLLNHYGKGAYRKVNGYFPYTHAERIIKKYKKKNVNVAFSEYCKVVPIEQQQEFWDVFEKGYRWRRHRDVTANDHWFIDKHDNIQFYKRPVYLRHSIHRSLDCSN